VVNARRSIAAWRALAVAALAVLSLSSTACQTPRTQVILAIDADPTILGLIDGFRVEVTNPRGDLQTSTASLADGQPLPRTLGLYWTSGALGPNQVVVSGMAGSSAVVARRLSFEFVPQQTLVLHVTLVGRCLSTTCPTGQTCAEAGCRGVEIAPTELEPWTGSIARRDGGFGPIDSGPDAPGLDAFVPPVDAFVPPADAFGPPDAVVVMPDAFEPPDAFAPPDAWIPDGCVPMPEICNGLDDDCNLVADEGFDLTMDEMNCGRCGNACNFANGMGECRMGVCAVTGCDRGFDDCNMDAADGCEVDLENDEMNCNMCGNVCDAGRMCCRGMCRMGGC
jgi:hypothetical protein